MKIGLISNRKSERNKRGLGKIVGALAASPDSLHAELGQISDLSEILRDFARREVGVVAINGGDGTVQATLTELFNARPFERMPVLAVLPGGMTNMIAHDIGCRRGPKAVDRLVEALAAGDLASRTVEREIIRLQHTSEGPPLYGMFFGAAGICRGILLCREAMQPKTIGSTAAVGATVISVLARRLIGSDRQDPILSGDPVTVRLDGGSPQSGSRLMVLITTLDRLILKSRPYWGSGPGGLRYTAISHPATGLLRAAYPLLYGRGARRFPSSDYVSRNADEVCLEMTCPFTVDGELYDPLPGVPISLKAGQRVRFLPC